MTPRNRKRCHSRATAKGRYLSAPLGIPQSTNLAPTPGGGVGLSNPRIFDDFFPKLGLIASISSQVPKNMRLIPHISTNYDTMNNCEQLWTALKHISRENLPGSCERGREGKMRSLRPVLPGGVEHHGQQTPGRNGGWRIWKSSHEMIWDVQILCFSTTATVEQNSESFWIVVRCIQYTKGCETALLCCQVTMLHSSDIVWRDPQSCHATFQLRPMCFGI